MGLATMERFGSKDEFLALFNPSRQLAMTKDKRETYMGDSPVLGLIRRTYGSGTAVLWMVAQLADLAEFAGCKEKLSPAQLEETARIALEEYGFFKLTEFMLFFQKFKRCEYGKFYGAVDPMIILGAMSDFARERMNEVSRYKQEEERKELEASYELVERQKARYAKLVPGAFTEDCPLWFYEWQQQGWNDKTDEEVSRDLAELTDKKQKQSLK